MKPTRREVLAVLAASACGLPREPGPASPAFPLGVACGDVNDNSGVLWTCFEGSGTLVARLWPRENDANPQTFEVLERDEQYAKLDVTGLQSNTWYRYVFSSHDDSGAELARSDLGQFRTAPALDALVPLTFGVSSCARQTEPLTPLARLAEDHALDAWLMLGDSVYADGATTLGEYRAKWKSGLSRRPNRLLRGATSLIATWDDHEVENDVSADRIGEDQLGVARQAFFEHQPMRPPGLGARIWRRLQWGRTADIFVLDCRGERNHAKREYISAQQLAWLENGLATSTATFKLIMNSVPISAYPGALYGAFAADRWQGWPEQREVLLRAVDQHRDGVLWLTGDFHMGVAGRVSLEGVGSNQVEIAAGPAGTNLPNPALSYPAPPQFDFASAVNNGVVLDLDPATRTARVRFVAGSGRILFDHTYTL